MDDVLHGGPDGRLGQLGDLPSVAQLQAGVEQVEVGQAPVPPPTIQYNTT